MSRKEPAMIYLTTMLWPYILVAIAAGLVIGWFSAEKTET